MEREWRGSEKATGGWARSEFEDLFKTYPRIKDAYWETIVKLWQLSWLEDDADMVIWQDHFLAWLVSSLSVLKYDGVEQAVVYSTLPQEYSTLTFRGEVVARGGGVEERSEVMYWHRGAYIIYYRNITCHSCIA